MLKAMLNALRAGTAPRADRRKFSRCSTRVIAVFSSTGLIRCQVLAKARSLAALKAIRGGHLALPAVQGLTLVSDLRNLSREATGETVSQASI
ncbi:MAG: hypothetical protein GY947_12335 [Rhodobacteraceae bacterium]|nr:hypothetical protein [Paracoccaceae bacterium]